MDHSADKARLSFCLIVTSDHVYSGLRKDENTPLVRSILERHGFKLQRSTVVPNSMELIAEAVLKYTEPCSVVMVTGGTGPSRRDVSLETVRTLAEKELNGFGELFRYLTYVEEGTKTWLSRASAFIVRGKLVIVVPGSPSASRLALEKIIIPEVMHIAKELGK